jgi:hypothetical protein
MAWPRAGGTSQVMHEISPAGHEILAASRALCTKIVQNAFHIELAARFASQMAISTNF